MSQVVARYYQSPLDDMTIRRVVRKTRFEDNALPIGRATLTKELTSNGWRLRRSGKEGVLITAQQGYNIRSGFQRLNTSKTDDEYHLEAGSSSSISIEMKWDKK